jgi:chromosomal replication initiation ATPase DnaA
MNPMIFAGLPEHIKKQSAKPFIFRNLKIEQLNRVLANACSLVGCEYSDLLTGGRKQEIITAKRLFCHYLRTYTNMTLTAIGRYLGLDHATVLHHQRTLTGYLDFNDEESIKLHSEYRSMNAETLTL